MHASSNFTTSLFQAISTHFNKNFNIYYFMEHISRKWGKVGRGQGRRAGWSSAGGWGGSALVIQRSMILWIGKDCNAHAHIMPFGKLLDANSQASQLTLPETPSKMTCGGFMFQVHTIMMIGPVENGLVLKFHAKGHC